MLRADPATHKGRADVRRVHCGSIYWLRERPSGAWVLTADGVQIAGPFGSRKAGLAALDAVAPEAGQ